MKKILTTLGWIMGARVHYFYVLHDLRGYLNRTNVDELIIQQSVLIKAKINYFADSSL